MSAQVAMILSLSGLLAASSPIDFQGVQAAQLAANQGAADRPFEDWLISQAREADLEPLEPFRAIYALVGIAESCHKIDRQKLADEFLDRAMKVAEKDKGRVHYFSLFGGAMKIGRLDIAEQIAKESKNNSLLDRWDLERFRCGHKDAIKDYPRDEMTFYNATELARVYVEKEEYDTAEAFVMNVKITEENDPEDVAGLILKEIAKRCREQGDLEKAKQYIDKAMKVAGRQFYTGYAIEVTHRSIHGRLTTDLEKFAKKGAAYRGHMGRELLLILVEELVRTGHFDEAKQTMQLLEQKSDRDRGMRALAIEQSARGDITAALKTVDELNDPQARNAARLGIAEVVAKTGNVKTAKKLADYVKAGMPAELNAAEERTYQELSGLYGRLGCRTEIEQMINQAKTPLLKVNCLSKAFAGYADR